MKKLLLVLPLAFALTACFTPRDDELAQKAAFTLGTTADKVTISNISKQGTSTNFTATVGGKATQCYVTSMFSVTGRNISDAICSGRAAANCNDLLRAAGKC